MLEFKTQLNYCISYIILHLGGLKINGGVIINFKHSDTINYKRLLSFH